MLAKLDPNFMGFILVFIFFSVMLIQILESIFLFMMIYLPSVPLGCKQVEGRDSNSMLRFYHSVWYIVMPHYYLMMNKWMIHCICGA